MAPNATIFRIKVDLSDIDRGVYQPLDLRVARHPSETMRFLVARVIAYCLCFEEGIAFTKGLSTTEEPAVWVKDLQGNTTMWIEIGTPSADRLHKASKACPRVVVFTGNDPRLLVQASEDRAIHRAEHIEVYALPQAFLESIGAALERTADVTMVHSGGELYVTVAGETFTAPVLRHGLSTGN